ncbi:unnamed protein product [Urochloa humidicola]
MVKLPALTVVVLVAVAMVTTIVSSTHGARTLKAERAAIPAAFVASPPTMDDVDFDVPLEETVAEGPAAAGPDAGEWNDKTPVSGQ